MQIGCRLEVWKHAQAFDDSGVRFGRVMLVQMRAHGEEAQIPYIATRAHFARNQWKQISDACERSAHELTRPGIVPARNFFQRLLRCSREQLAQLRRDLLRCF